jgi:hypothetical protein
MAFKVNEFRAHFSKYGEFSKSDKFEVNISIPQILTGRMKDSKELTFQCEVAELPGRTINTIDFVHYGFTERTPHFTSYEPVTLTFYCNGEMKEKKFFDAWMNTMIPADSGLVNYRENADNTMLYTSDVTIVQYSQYAGPIGAEEKDEPETLNRVLKETAIRAAKDIGKASIEKAIGVPFGGIEQILGLGGESLVSQQQKVGNSRKVYECTLVQATPVAMSPLSLNWADDSVQRLQVTFVYKKWSTREIPILPIVSIDDLVSNYGAKSIKDKLRKRGQDILSAGIDKGVDRSISKTTDVVLGKIKF